MGRRRVSRIEPSPRTAAAGEGPGSVPVPVLRSGPFRWRPLLASIALGAFLAAGACRPIDPNEDARIEAEIKARLVEEKFANLTRLGVLSRGGVVSLAGLVASTEEKGRAEVIARGVHGVVRVVNTLQVEGD